MAATILNQPDGFNLFGTIPVQFAQITLDASYPAGGYALNGQQFGLAGTLGPGAAANGIIGITVISINTAGIGYVFLYNEQTGKLQVEWTGPVISGVLAEVAPTTNLSTVVLRVIVYGSGE